MQTRRDAIVIIIGVLLVTAMGETVRRLGLKRAAARLQVNRNNAVGDLLFQETQTKLTGGHAFRYGVEFLRQTITEEAAGATLGKTAFLGGVGVYHEALVQPARGSRGLVPMVQGTGDSGASRPIPGLSSIKRNTGRMRTIRWSLLQLVVKKNAPAHSTGHQKKDKRCKAWL